MTDRADALAPLREIALRFPSGATSETALPRVGIVRHDAPTEPMSGVFRPMMCMVLQGAKEASIGGKTIHYDEASYLLATLELAATGRVIQASQERPYLCVALSIDLEGLASLLPAVPVKEEGQQPAFAVNPVTDDLIAAWGRLLGLLDTPEDIPVLAPLIEREILYRLLQGPQGAVLRQAAFAGSHHAQVRRAMLWLKEHYAEPMRIDDLAGMAGMSPASFHRHFKAAAAMSPLQYQKTLRLQEARRLLASNADAARTAFAVGYESPSQFSREYARAFGLPPARDAQRLKGMRMEEAV